ncbi:hypothetical protein R3W88_014957 [Solanum pinnatisectum]|uniref:DUF1985 domain-containing protein n=1 Tax=Solanum pinnatisectum TaxID=50273 RepID=A0AAV9KT53_9SOLN|nr:hypothetical protein R3W88_014957 [Solanum pinnatisectum]
MDKTPRKSPRLNKHAMTIDSPSIESSRPMNELTKAPNNRISNNINECIVIDSSASFKLTKTPNNRISNNINECIVIDSSAYFKVSKYIYIYIYIYVGDSKSKGKEKVRGGILPHDSDFEDEIPLVRNIAGGSGISVSKPLNPKGQSSTLKKRKKLIQPLKIKKKQFRWCLYINMNVFVDITERLAKINCVNLFKESPFDFLLDLPILKVQPQIIRSLVHHLSNKRDNMFVVNINGKELHFGLREFRAVTGFKCGGRMDFDHDPNSTSKLLSRYFPNASDKVLKAEFIRVFKEDRLIVEDDLFNMSMIYFISTFILSSPPKYSHIPKDYFLCVESGQYLSYSWGNLSFFNLRHSISSQMARDPDHVKFEGFPLALQIWFCECCNKVDASIAIHSSNRTPRIFNWDISKNKIFLTISKKEYVLFMEEELVAIEVEKLNNLNHSAFKKKSKHGSFARQSDNVQAHDDEMDNDKEVPHNSAHHVRNDLGKLERNIDDKFNKMKAFMYSSFKHIIEELKSIKKRRKEKVDVQNEHLQDCVQSPSDLNTHTLDDFVMPNMHESQLVALETGHTYVSSLVDVEYGNICFNQIGVGEGENTHHVRAKIPGKYAQSPYTILSESSVTSVFFTAASNPIDPPCEYGVGRVKLMDWFHPLAYPGQPWGDLINFLLYESLISIHHEVAQYIRGDKILANTPWVDVDHVCIQVNSSVAFHWFLVVFSIRKRCLYIYDSLNAYGVKHTKAVTSLVQKLSKMIHLFLIATDYYGLRKDIDWNTGVHYASRSVGDPLVYGNRENVPQQRDNST